MPKQLSKRDRSAAKAPSSGRGPAPETTTGPAANHVPETTAGVRNGTAGHNGNGNGNGSNNHGRRRSGRVTYQPKAAAILTTHARTEDERLLDTGLRPAFLDSDPWRSLRILAEFVEGFDALASIGKAVTIFGSARLGEGDPYYAKARELAGLLAKDGFSVITGGGPGHHGGRQSRLPRGGRALDRLQHRAAPRAGRQSVRGSGRRVPLLLRAEDDVRQIRRRASRSSPVGSAPWTNCSSR